MAKIAIIDLFFYWPPGGGSHVDVKEIALRLAKIHKVKFFVPNMKGGKPLPFLNIDFILRKTKFFNRGSVKEPLDFEIIPIDFDCFSFNCKTAPKKFLAELKKFNPDFVFFAQGSFMKPHIINYLDDYKIISRHYSNEAFCLKGDGQYYRDNKICDVDYLDGEGKSYRTCFACSAGFLLGYPSPLFIQEYLTSFAFTRSHQAMLIESIKKPSSVIVYNDFIRSKLLRFNENTVSVPGGVNISDFANVAPTQTHDGIKKILMLGRSDDKTKGFDLLFHAASRIWEKRKDFRILMTVRDSLPSKYNRDFIVNLGWVPHSEIPKIYASSNIVVVPSRWSEPFGIVAVEAFASGKPVVASRVGGLQTIIDHGGNGFLFDPKNIKELKENIVNLLDDPDLCKKMGETGREKAKREYDWSIVFEKYYRNLFT